MLLVEVHERTCAIVDGDSSCEIVLIDLALHTILEELFGLLERCNFGKTLLHEFFLLENEANSVVLVAIAGTATVVDAAGCIVSQIRISLEQLVHEQLVLLFGQTNLAHLVIRRQVLLPLRREQMQLAMLLLVL